MTVESSIILIPHYAETPDQIEGFVQAGAVFFVGDRVALTHRPSGSVLFGTLGGIYGVGRIRGFKVENVPFGVGSTGYPMGKPSDANYRLSLIERGGKANAFGLAWYMRSTQGDTFSWSDLTGATREAYIKSAALADAEKIRTTEDPPYLSTDDKINRYEQEES